jgi:hypothetical protein
VLSPEHRLADPHSRVTFQAPLILNRGCCTSRSLLYKADHQGCIDDVGVRESRDAMGIFRTRSLRPVLVGSSLFGDVAVALRSFSTRTSSAAGPVDVVLAARHIA